MKNKLINRAFIFLLPLAVACTQPVEQPEERQETPEPEQSTEEKFTCNDGKTVIKLSYVRDGECDCPDCDDEE